MSVDDGMIAVAVYLPREREGSLEELLRKAGLTPTRTDQGGWTYARWERAKLSVEAYLHEQQYHRMIWIKLWESEWLSQRPDASDECPRASDGGMALVYALRELCVQLQPDVAMFLAHRWQDEDWLAGEDWAVVANDVDALLALHPGVLYVNDEIAGHLDNADVKLANRERIDVDHGLMVLAGTGWGRFS